MKINTKSNLKVIQVFLVWSIFIFLCSFTLKNFYIPTKPPLWDNLAYQLEALQILRDWLNGGLQAAIPDILNSRTPAHVSMLSFGFLMFGMNPISPYLISALVGFGCLFVLFLLLKEFGVSRRVAFWGVLFFSLSPNYLYQNYFQTRNDYVLALFLTLAWLFLLKGVKHENRKLMLISGIISGIGVMFKPSGPAYIIFGLLTFLFFPEKYILIKFYSRVKLFTYFTVGALLACGWHYLPNISKSFEYYKTWSGAFAWKASQYNLESNISNYHFYLKNIVENHIGMTPSILIGILIVVLVFRKYYVFDKSPRLFLDPRELSLYLLTFCAAFLPLIFISITNSYSSLGDVPVLLLITSLPITLIYKLSTGIYVRKYILVILLMIGFVYSFPKLPIAERDYYANDLNIFTEEISAFRNKFGFNKDKIYQVYSHPYYNVDTYKWLALINSGNNYTIPETDDLTNLVFPEDPLLIAKKLSTYPMLILSEKSGIVIGGEKFHTLNRLHAEINQALINGGNFIVIKKFNLENNSFPVSLALNKNYKKINMLSITRDNWMEWEGRLDYFSYLPSNIIWSGNTIMPLKDFRLIEEGGGNIVVNFKLKGHAIDGTPIYESENIPGSLKIRRFKLYPPQNFMAPAASEKDPRKLAFYNLKLNFQ